MISMILMLAISSLSTSEFTPSFTYRFVDSSVPPQYHRSYTIVVKPGSASLEIDSYGDILLQFDTDVPEKEFKKFLTKVVALRIKNTKETSDQGCTGGTGENIDFIFSPQSRVKGYVYHCQGDYGNLKGKLSMMAEVFKAMIPDFGAKLASTESN